MEIPDKILDTYRNYLMQCDYPNISKMDNEDVKKVLNKGNRTTFLLWALIKFNPANESRFDRYKKIQKLDSVLAETLYSNGCCLTSQKNDFVLGKLKIDEEIIIFSRLFKLLCSVNKNVDRENISPQIASIIFSLQHLDTDFEEKVFVKEKLFEDNIKPMKDDARLEMLNKYDEESVELDQEFVETASDLETVRKELCSFEAIEIVSDEAIKDISNKVSKLTSDFAKDFPEYSAHFLKLPDKSIADHLGLKVKTCSENIRYVEKVRIKTFNSTKSLLYSNTTLIIFLI